MTRGLKLLLPPFYLPREAVVRSTGGRWRSAGRVRIADRRCSSAWRPRVQASRVDLAGSMRASSSTVTADRRRRRLRDALVVVEVALSCVLLAGARLLMPQLLRAAQVEPARDPATLLVAPLAHSAGAVRER